MNRNVEARIVKLEAKRRDDAILLIWYKGDAGEAIDAARHLFAPGDPVMCAEWCGVGDLPAPRWHRDFPAGLTDDELASLKQTLDQLVAGVGSSKDSAWPLTHLSDRDLWFQILKVD